MFLKRIEMHGFKSFSNKIVLEFHNGITGIVGPNGSGKSNISDAVRWVLGEQSARQLRGASMQDVIFAGTENRKALSFAYVALTLDNADHVLPYDYEEVTVSRRVYRSGESEYQINKVPCRLRDIQELFYDTGIGKEGYSIIGQGQIERILSSKPEDRRELFDEAVGIVKYKKRKDAAVKHLGEERANLERITDILNELNTRVGPLEEQAKAAKRFVELREQQKRLEINLFLIDSERLRNEEKQFLVKRTNIKEELSDLHKKSEEITSTFESYETSLKEAEELIESLRQKERSNSLIKSNLYNQIELCKEQINSANQRLESFDKRREEIKADKERHQKELDEFEEKKKSVEELLSDVTKRLEQANTYNKELDDAIRNGSEKIEKLNAQLINLLNERTEIKASKQRFDTMIEQANINKSQLNQRALAQKTSFDELRNKEAICKKEYEDSLIVTKELEEKNNELTERKAELINKSKEISAQVDKNRQKLNIITSKLETVRSISERYEGYGNAVRRVMEKKDTTKGVVGVVADLISVDKRYETAIETALGGNIQNVVTEDESSARSLIEYLKSNKLGRVTFLPITSVKEPKELHGHDILDESGVEGLACDLVNTDKRFLDIITYLLGRVVVCKDMTSGLSLAKKYRYSHHIVTLDGEYLRPGGSITGGAFKHSGNLLARNREIDDLEKEKNSTEEIIKDILSKRDEYNTAIELIEDDFTKCEESYRQALLDMNTAKIRLEGASGELKSADDAATSLKEEREELEERLIDISVKIEESQLKLSESENSENNLKAEIKKIENEVDEKRYIESSAARNLSEIQIEEASARQEVGFVKENIDRVVAEIEKNKHDEEEIERQNREAIAEVETKQAQIEEINLTLSQADVSDDSISKEIEEKIKQKDEMNKKHSELFKKKEEIADDINKLEKEEVRLETAEERVIEESRKLNDHMWYEYELTLHGAMELKDDTLTDAPKIKSDIGSIKEEIRSLGDVNVSAIDEYAEVAERHKFLTGQYDDIVEAENRLIKIIEELDEGMRERFTKGFAEIAESFDKVFKELFGGGKGTLELAEGEDVLESGIKIIAQPPGKKLQNMMQLSGGEKAFTAIALLFAILNLKPSPFCLLDEIEAALDEPNVDRFAKYLKNLTDNTQFIIITHRRGTMNSADRLYGITMQEKGISTLVSVNLIEDELEE